LLQTTYSPPDAEKLLLKRLLIAIPQAINTRVDFKSFDESLRQEMLGQVIKAERDLAAWADDKSCPDPYHIPRSSK
jgi:hypothetical protein